MSHRPHRIRSLSTALALALGLAVFPAWPGLAAAPAGPEAPSAGDVPWTGETRARIVSFVQGTLDELGVPPGLALAVVRGDEVLLAEGFGYRDAEAGRPVEADTPFYIASSTKSFVGLAAALLHHRGELDLDGPLEAALPGARLPESAGTVTLRQLLTHTSGLENEPIVIRTAYTGDYTPELLVKLLAATRVNDRSFDYTNLGYVLAGLAIDRVVEGTWKDFLRRELFDPLGMERTTAYVSEAASWPVAAAYDASPAGSQRIPFVKVDATMHPAGGLLSTARDLAQWLRLQLGGGRLGDRRVVPAEVLEETHRPQAELDRTFFLFHRTGYGLGWYVSDYEGDRLLHHFGGFNGFRAHVSFMPEHGLGVVALINETGHGFFVPDLVAAFVYDLLLGKPGLEARYRERRSRMAAEVAERKEGLAAHVAERRRREWTLSLPMAAYEGTYRSELLGEARLARQEGDLVLTIGALEAPVEPFTDPDSVRTEIVPGSGTVLRFRVQEGSGVAGFESEGLFWERVKQGASDE